MERILAPLILVLVLVAAFESRASDQPRPRCALQHLTSCATTSDLVWSREFNAAIKRFGGNETVGYFGSLRRRLGEEAVVGLGGPPEPRVALPGSSYLFSACPAHNCGGNGAAIILDQYGHIEALGFSSFHCPSPCDVEHRYLDFYVTRSPLSAPLISTLTAWGKGPTLTSMTEPAVNYGIDERIVVHYLPH